MAREPLVGQGLLSVQISKPHSDTPHIRLDSFGRVIDPLSENTQHSKGTDIRAPGRIRTRNPSKREALDRRHRQHCHWDWLLFNIPPVKVN